MIERLIVLSIALLLACGGDDDGGGLDAAPSGRACVSGAGPEDQTLIATPSLDCPSRTCLHVMGVAPDQCTASCQDESDCAASTEAACEGEFACTAVLGVGPFACQKLCVCASSVPEGGFPVDCASWDMTSR